MKGCEYIFTSDRKKCIFMVPFQASLIDIFVDVTYTGSDCSPYLLNVVTFNEKTLVYNAVASVLTSIRESGSYGNHFQMAPN